jgi:phage terminase large subunit
MPQPERLYKIVHSVTGLYSNGGTHSKWTRKGKVWQGIGPLKNHLAQFKAIPADWVVVAIEQVIKNRTLAKALYPVPNPSAYVTAR